MYCIDGSDNRFPPLYGDNAPFSSGYDCLHPNCRHHLVPYFEDKESPNDFEKMRKESNKPFKDNRTSAEVKQYQRGQARNRQVYEKIQRNLQDEKEYSKIKRLLNKDNIYNTFEDFKSDKGKNTEQYQEIKKAVTQLENLDKTAIKVTKLRNKAYDNLPFNIKSKQVIITKKQYDNHIAAGKNKHNNIYSKVKGKLSQIINEPDIIFKDKKNINTILVAKQTEGALVVVKLSCISKKLDNTIITIIDCGEKTFNRMKRNYQILYTKR